MGGVVSAGADNDGLVDNLLAENYIRTPSVERVLRAVDRGSYFTPLGRASAYKDSAWKSGNIHLSAPCIYCEVMENLSLGPGMSFLNLGSGTGYLSTMAGLILGSYGTNHGIEIHEDVIQYAHEKLEEFKKTAPAIEEYDFCEPKFFQGNCLQLDSGTMKYDRVYCGAGCPPSFEYYMKSLIKVGGILVIPFKDQLLQIRRVSEKVWDSRFVLPVSFADLVEPTLSSVVVLPAVEPVSLMNTCRTTIRSILKAAVDCENPELQVQYQPKTKSKKRTRQHLVIPMFGDGEPERVAVITNLPLRYRGVEVDSDDASTHSLRSEPSHSNGTSCTPPGGELIGSPSTASTGEFTPERFHLLEDALSSDADSDAPSSSDTSSSNSLTSIYQVQRALFHAMTTYAVEPLNSSAPADTVHPPPVLVPPSISTVSKLSTNDYGITSSDSSTPSDYPIYVEPADSNDSKTKSSTKRGRTKRKKAELGNYGSTLLPDSEQKSSNINTESSDSEQTYSRSKKKSGAKREKVDSGIGEDIKAVENWEISASDLGSDVDLASDSDSDEEGAVYKPNSHQLRRGRNRNVGAQKEKKAVSPTQANRQQKASTFIVCMRSKIQQLPLPYSMKSFINYHRDL